MTRERLAAILAAYGADPDRWPLSERAAAEAAARDDGARALVEAAAEQDRSLGILPSEFPTEAMRARILSDFDGVSARRAAGPASRLRAVIERVRDAVWPGAPLWQPASALALSLIVGIVAGVVVPTAVDGREMSDQSTMLPIDAPSDVDLDHGI